MKSLKNMTGDSLEQMIDYKVVDQNGASIGTLHSLWSDPTTGGVEFLGVKTGWLFGHNLVVPAEKAELDEADNVVRLPYTELFIKEAPSMPADAEISEVEEENIYEYYGLASPTHAEIDTGTAAIQANEAALAGNADAAATRWRRTSRAEEGGHPVAFGNLTDLSDMNVAAANAVGNVLPPTYGTANMLGGPSGGGTAYGSDPDTETGDEEHTNADPITGEPGAHPVGTGLGAVSAGVAGLAIGGAVGGPIGAPIGAAVGGLVGAIGGGLAGKGVAEILNPTAEDAYWASEYRNAPYYEDPYEYADYAPAYRVGYEGFGVYGVAGRDYSEVEPDLEQQYSKNRGTSKLEWEKAKLASRHAWDRLKAKFTAAK
jgi:hypothetical protein